MMALLISIKQGELLKLTDTDAVSLFATCFGPELYRLRDAKVTVEASPVHPAGSLGKRSDDTPSRYLFSKDYAEVNKMLLSMLGLKWLLANDYELFTGCQSSHSKLTRASFNKLRAFFLGRLPGADEVYALFVLMVVSDVGKDPNLARDVQQLQAMTTGNHAEPSPVNHDVVTLQAAEAGLLPSLQDHRLPADLRQDVLLGLELGAKLNVAQLAQAENVPGSLCILRKFRDRARAYNLRVMEILLDVAGAGAVRDTRCCGLMTEPVFQSYMTTVAAMDTFLDGTVSSERECYDRVLRTRANALAQTGFALLSTTSDDERALLRLLTIGRVMDRQRAELFQTAFGQLPSPVRQRLVKGLNTDGLSLSPNADTDTDTAVIPYYAPGLLAETLKNSPDGSLIRALAAFMRFLARVVVVDDPTGIGAAEQSPVIVVERDLSFAQTVIKSKGFRDNPDVLDAIPVPWPV